VPNNNKDMEVCSSKLDISSNCSLDKISNMPNGVALSPETKAKRMMMMKRTQTLKPEE
jgi:hypothetical protein